MRQIKIHIPATTANLGPGFDCLGVALNIFNKAAVSWQDSNKLTPYQLGDWAVKLPFEQRAIAEAYSYYAKQNEIDLPKITIEFTCEIPVARGLGSSATCAIAGILAAQIIHKGDWDKNELLNLSAKLEGHPDNVAPAILGGLVLSGKDSDKVVTSGLACHENIHVFLMIPDYKLATKAARSVLPEKILHGEAVKQLVSFGFLLQGLASGRRDYLKQGNYDFLHEPYRRKLIPEYETIKKDALSSGCSAVSLSGAGPSLVGIYSGFKAEAEQVESALTEKLPAGWQLKHVQVDHSGVVFYSSPA
ncbi:MAG: homoserine kinase [Fastidiosipila sp.]|nr:homoserine kinase [Fastidiosipila sp.]